MGTIRWILKNIKSKFGSNFLCQLKNAAHSELLRKNNVFGQNIWQIMICLSECDGVRA